MRIASGVEAIVPVKANFLPSSAGVDWPPSAAITLPRSLAEPSSLPLTAIVSPVATVPLKVMRASVSASPTVAERSIGAASTIAPVPMSNSSG